MPYAVAVPLPICVLAGQAAECLATNCAFVALQTGNLDAFRPAFGNLKW